MVFFPSSDFLSLLLLRFFLFCHLLLSFFFSLSLLCFFFLSHSLCPQSFDLQFLPEATFADGFFCYFIPIIYRAHHVTNDPLSVSLPLSLPSPINRKRVLLFSLSTISSLKWPLATGFTNPRMSGNRSQYLAFCHKCIDQVTESRPDHDYYCIKMDMIERTLNRPVYQNFNWNTNKSISSSCSKPSGSSTQWPRGLMVTFFAPTCSFKSILFLVSKGGSYVTTNVIERLSRSGNRLQCFLSLLFLLYLYLY